MDEQRRAEVLAELAKYTGKRVPYTFLKQTSKFIPSIERFHNLITGIFKPVWSEYALSIAQFVNSPYAHKDESIFSNDGRWLMEYAPRKGGLNHPDNIALLKCLSDQVPLGVFKQLDAKGDKLQGANYLVMGLGLISGYDSTREVFLLESANPFVVGELVRHLSEEREQYEVQLYSQVTNEFRATAPIETISYTANQIKRDEAFRSIVLREYAYACAVCNLKFHHGPLVEAQAAHIIAKGAEGTDDPRNGIALCRTHHWAFDSGIFSVDEGYEVIPSPILKRAEVANFDLAGYSGKTLYLPQNEALKPHPLALDWHRSNVFRK